MKKSILLITISFILFGITACKKDDSNDSTTPTVSNLMKAKIDGVDWTSLSSKTTGSIESNLSTCSGKASDSSAIAFSVTDEIVENQTYDLGFGSANNAGYGNINSAIPWLTNGDPACTGTLTITSINKSSKKMSGTFSFKAYNSNESSYVEVTNGVFTNVSYTSSLSGTVNLFSVKIDGVNWVPSIVYGEATGGDITIDALSITGDKSVTLSFPDNITPGNYTLDGTTHAGYYMPDLMTIAISTSGNLTIVSHNTSTNTIEGVFNFVAMDLSSGGGNYNITNGSFTVHYQ